jgi:hypothetical protein
VVLTGPLIIPAWKPELASPKDIADAIAADWFYDEVFTTAECVHVIRTLQPQRLAPTPPIRLNSASKASAHSLDLRFTPASIINKHKWLILLVLLRVPSVLLCQPCTAYDYF